MNFLFYEDSLAEGSTSSMEEADPASSVTGTLAVPDSAAGTTASGTVSAAALEDVTSESLENGISDSVEGEDT